VAKGWHQCDATFEPRVASIIVMFILVSDAPKTQRERQRQLSHNGGPGRRPVTGFQGGDAGEGGEWEGE
jgi:hypothetical protein